MMISVRVQLLIVSLILVSGCEIDPISSSKNGGGSSGSGYLGPIVVDFPQPDPDPDTVSITDNKGLPIENNGFIIMGNRSSLGCELFEINLLDRNEIWRKRYSRKGNAIIKTVDGGYVITGRVRVNDPIIGTHWSVETVWLMKTDSEGNIEWEIIDEITGVGESVKQTEDGGYIVVGYVSKAQNYSLTNYVPANDDGIIFKTDAYGEIEWNKTFGGDEDEGAIHIETTEDNGSIMAGFKRANNGARYPLIIKFNEHGDQIWNRYFVNVGYGGLGSWIEKTQDNGYIILASAYTSYIVKTDSLGLPYWHKPINANVRSLEQTVNSGFIAIGDKLTAIDPSGNQLWTKDIKGNSIQQIEGGFYIIVADSNGSTKVKKIYAYGGEIWNQIFY